MIAVLLALAGAPTGLPALLPPIDRALHYRTIEHRPGAGGERSFTLRQDATFTRDRDGYLLTLRAVSYTLAAPPADRPLLDATMRPMIGNPVRIHMTAGGVPDRVVDGAASWSAFIAGVRALATRSADAARIARVADALAATPPETRDAQLIENADDIVAPRLPPLGIGQIVAEAGVTTARGPDIGGASHFHRLALRPAPAPARGQLSIEEDVEIAPDTGLVRRRARIVRLLPGAAAAPVPISATETVMVR